ncbi:MAG: class I SAM-dependent methyltransferase [Acidimicrobiales bacterium]|nr:class I SAM-dependent methyltransferase [Acidimicrobiales bacterium]
MVATFVHRELPLAVRAWDGTRAGPDDAEITLVVHSPEAIRHLLWAPGELGLVRAHVQGHLEIEGDVFTLLSLRDRIDDPDVDVSLKAGPRDWLGLLRQARRLGVVGWRPPIPQEESRVRGRLGTIRRASQAIGHHYDVSNEFYELLLGPALTYSCAYWTRSDATLEDAQEAKHELVCRKLALEPGQRLLDIGCGWGSMAIHAARRHGAHVVAITLSEEQALFAARRVNDAGLAHLVDVRIQDYREIDDEPFDAISSIGMFEHVPTREVGRYLRTAHDLLKPGGRVLNHAISRPDPTSAPEVEPKSFMGRYVFPDATLHEVGAVVSSMHRAGLEVRDLQSLREHYALTLRAWVANLEAGWDTVQKLVGPGRARVWRLYLAGSALGFEQYRTSVYQVLAVRTPVSGSSQMPPTRTEMDVPAEFGLLDLRSARTTDAVESEPRRADL